jgi:hypothetical protein
VGAVRPLVSPREAAVRCLDGSSSAAVTSVSCGPARGSPERCSRPSRAARLMVLVRSGCLGAVGFAILGYGIAGRQGSWGRGSYLRIACEPASRRRRGNQRSGPSSVVTARRGGSSSGSRSSLEVTFTALMVQQQSHSRGPGSRISRASTGMSDRTKRRSASDFSPGETVRWLSAPRRQRTERQQRSLRCRIWRADDLVVSALRDARPQVAPSNPRPDRVTRASRNKRLDCRTR